MKQLSALLIFSALMTACGGESDTQQPPTSGNTEPPEQIAGIHDTVPSIDYFSVSTDLYVSFDNYATGTYTEELLQQDFDPNPVSTDIKEASYEITGGELVYNDNNNVRLQLTLPAQQTGEGLKAKIPLDSDYTELYLSYLVTFPEDFIFAKGFKLPGLAGIPGDGANTPSGCSYTYAADSGSSTRLMVREQGRGIAYPYIENAADYEDSDQLKGCGLSNISLMHEGETFYYQAGKTYLIEQKVVMNTPDQADGIFDLYINGYDMDFAISRDAQADTLVNSLNAISYSTSGEFGVNYLLLHIFRGGKTEDWHTDVDTVLYLDDVALSLQPVTLAN